jgi:hypothetical protein
MKNAFTLNMSTIVFVAAVHAIGGVGLGMWLAQRLPLSRQRSIGLALMAGGVALHIPMRRAVMNGRRDNTKPLAAAR